MRRPAASTRATGRRATKSTAPPASATADSTSARFTPCQTARSTGLAVASSASVAALMRPSAMAGTTPSSRVQAASTAAGATNQAEGLWLVSTAGGAFAQSVAPAVKAPHTKRML
jgi:hypothetical protein